MKILHVGHSFRPLHWGGLVTYAEDLMEAQVQQGHQVAYFFSGRRYPWRRGPAQRRWSRGGVTMLEVLNSPVVPAERGIVVPEWQWSEPHTESLFRQALTNFAPHVVHFQELSALPSSLLRVAREHGIPTVMTLHNYFLLCPTFNLFDVDDEVCLRRIPGAQCVHCCAVPDSEASRPWASTIAYEQGRVAERLPRLYPTARSAYRTVAPLAGRLRRPRGGTAHGPDAAPPTPRRLDPAPYNERRRRNVDALNTADALIAVSTRVGEIYRHLGVEPELIRTIHMSAGHLEKLVPRGNAGVPSRVRFATLSGAAYVAKGAKVLAQAVAELDRRGYSHRYTLLVFGAVDVRVQAELAQAAAVELRGTYDASDLNGILDSIDVGVVPSVCEESYGFAGVEFLSKAIPVIGSKRGGISDYTETGETGWLNETASGTELAAIMADIIDNPGQLVDLHNKIRARRSRIIKPVSRHIQELDAVYRELIAARTRREHSANLAASVVSER